MINEADRKFLLELARASIVGENLARSKIPASLKTPGGVFVTLTKKGELRGCIGFIEAIMPIHQVVSDCAYSAAYRDYRFPPVEKGEIGSLHIEISVLTKPVKLKHTSVDALLKKLESKPGVIIEKSDLSAVFLPQVWEELPEPKEFLNHLCRKAGLAPDAWQAGDLEVETFTVEKFSENRNL